VTETITRHADRLAIRELVDAWARCADRRLPAQQAALFTPDGTVTVHMGGQVTSEPAQRLQGHAELTESFRALDAYDTTTHLNGQCVLEFSTDDPNAATGESYCLAHHVWTENGQRVLMVMAIRYLDTFVRSENDWLFADRRLVVDWIDKRPSTGN
jgi:hypothetical protein